MKKVLSNILLGIVFALAVVCLFQAFGVFGFEKNEYSETAFRGRSMEYYNNLYHQHRQTWNRLDSLIKVEKDKHRQDSLKINQAHEWQEMEHCVKANSNAN